MLLLPYRDIAQLIQFLKKDYANNLYFFTYLDPTMIREPENRILVGMNNAEILTALLLTPIHCSISSSNMEYLELAARQMPPIDSIHVVGRKDYVEKLLSIAGPERNKNHYTLCQVPAGILYHNRLPVTIRASHADLKDLVLFYRNNDMLYDAPNRLPGILNWGRIYYGRYNGKIVSCALTTTETDDAAMIGAVFTYPEYRCQGYARSCVMGICHELIKDKKVPYLFYQTDNLQLERFYSSLGFRNIGDWLLATRTVD